MALYIDPSTGKISEQVKPTVNTEFIGGSVVNGQYLPPTDGGSIPNMPNGGAGTSNVSSGMARAEELLKDISTPMENAESIRRQELSRKNALLESANTIFDPLMASARETGAKKIGSTEGQFGVARGLGLSTANLSFLGTIQKETDARIAEINKSKADYLATGNMKYAEMADAAIAKLSEAKDNIILKKIELGLQLDQNAQAQEQSAISNDIAIYNAVSKIPEGKSITIGGKTYTGMSKETIDPFFSGSDVVNLMKSIPSGTSKEIQDPNTGAILTITGLSSDDPNTSTIQSTDDKGQVFITTYDKATGEVLKQVNAGKVGKTKTQAGSTTINMPSYGNLQVVYDKDGKELGTIMRDSKTGKLLKQDLNGNEITDFPAEATFGKPEKDILGEGISFLTDGGVSSAY